MLYGGGAILERTAVVLALTRLRFSQPYISLSTMVHAEVASLEAIVDMMAVASFPQAP